MAVLVDDDPKGTLRLEGQVVDGEDHPVSGATVLVSSNPPRTATTEADGGFAFDGLVARPYTLVARAPQGVAGPVTAKLNEKTDPVVLQLRAGSKVIAQVTDESGKPIDGATVELRGLDTVRQTAKAGTATFTPVAPGPYQLAAWAEGKARTLQWTQVSAGDTTERLVLVAGAKVTGRVVDDLGVGLANAIVTFHGASDCSQQADPRHDGATTDKFGAFTFDAMPAGSFRFAASHSDFARGASAIVTLDGKRPQDGIVITLGEGAVVRGTVVDSRKQPVASARVRVGVSSKRGMIFEPPRQVYSDGKGVFEIRGLPRNELQAVAIHETGASQSVVIDTTNRDADNVTLMIDVTGTIAGTVVDPAGQPVEGVQVSAGPNFTDQKAMGDFTQFRLRGFPQELTDATGKFSLTGLQPGATYMINASRPRAAAERRMTVEGVVAPTGKQDLRIVLQPEGGVKGKIAFADGSVPAAYTVAVNFSSQAFAGKGDFVIDSLTPQKYDLSVRGPSFQARAIEVTIEPGKVTDVGTITVAKGRQLAGRVLADGQPVEGATVHAGRQLFGNGTSNSAPSFGPMGQGAKTATTGPDGTFSLSGFNAGDLAIVAEHPTIGRSKALRVPTEMPGQGELVLELQKFGALKGILRASGKPVEGVFVSVQSTTTPGAIYGVASGPDGAYRYDKLAPDTYKVSATVGMPMMGMKFYSKEVVVPAGKEVSIDLAVEPGSVTLNVLPVAKSGKVGVASAWVTTGTIAAKTAADLSLRMAAAGVSSSQWIIVQSGEAAKFPELLPGTYTACVVTFPAEVQGMAAMGYVDRHSDALPAYCQGVRVNAAPDTQTATVAVEIPAFVPDDTGAGSGSAH